jgi:hypothetical protein
MQKHDIHDGLFDKTYLLVVQTQFGQKTFLPLQKAES